MFANEDRLEVARTIPVIEKGCCTVQIVTVADTDLAIEARVPLRVIYPVKPDSQMECAAIFVRT